MFQRARVQICSCGVPNSFSDKPIKVAVRQLAVRLFSASTIRNERLYTYSCVSTASEFLLAYHEMLLIADTFSFTNKIQKTPNTEDNDISI